MYVGVNTYFAAPRDMVGSTRDPESSTFARSFVHKVYEPESFQMLNKQDQALFNL